MKKTLRGKMINLVLNQYLKSILFEVVNIDKIQIELKNLLESHFKFIVQVSDINIINENEITGNVYFDDGDNVFKVINFHVANKQ